MVFVGKKQEIALFIDHMPLDKWFSFNEIVQATRAAWGTVRSMLMIAYQMGIIDRKESTHTSYMYTPPKYRKTTPDIFSEQYQARKERREWRKKK